MFSNKNSESSAKKENLLQERRKRIAVENNIPAYEYHKKIKSTEDLGMSSEGSFSAIKNNVKGLNNYVAAMVSGGRLAAYKNTNNGALGDKYFQLTMGNCIDCNDCKSERPRSFYINNIPDGNMPFIESRAKDLRGVGPGMVHNIMELNPLALLKIFPKSSACCNGVSLEQIEYNGSGIDTKKVKWGWIMNSEIQDMPRNWFIVNGKQLKKPGIKKCIKPPKETEKPKAPIELFTGNINDNRSYNNNNNNNNNTAYAEMFLILSLICVVLLSINKINRK